MNNTPRTDAIAHRGYNESAYIAEMTDLARQLERENQTFRAAQKACEDCDAPRVDRIAELERELAAERALADRLASVLRTYNYDLLAGEMIQFVPEHDVALAAWEEARTPPVGCNPSPTPAEIDAHLDELLAKSAVSWKPLPGDLL